MGLLNPYNAADNVLFDMLFDKIEILLLNELEDSFC
jgi:hypothetical protein